MEEVIKGLHFSRRWVFPHIIWVLETLSSERQSSLAAVVRIDPFVYGLELEENFECPLTRAPGELAALKLFRLDS
jgi:hypothetical protein